MNGRTDTCIISASVTDGGGVRFARAAEPTAAALVEAVDCNGVRVLVPAEHAERYRAFTLWQLGKMKLGDDAKRTQLQVAEFAARRDAWKLRYDKSAELYERAREAYDATTIERENARADAVELEALRREVQAAERSDYSRLFADTDPELCAACTHAGATASGIPLRFGRDAEAARTRADDCSAKAAEHERRAAAYRLHAEHAAEHLMVLAGIEDARAAEAREEARQAAEEAAAITSELESINLA